VTRSSGRPLHLLWIANVASPYRRPVWSALAREVRLVVALLESDDRMRQDGRRGADWRGAVSSAYRVIRTATVRVVRGEEVYYALSAPWKLPIRRTDAVLLGGWESPAFWQALLLAKLTRTGTVGFYESTEATNRFRTGPVAAARSFFFRRLDAVVVPGESAAALLRTFGVPETRTFVGFNAVDVAAFAAAAAAARAEGAPVSSGHRFVYVGQLIARKNVDGLLRAFAAARESEDVLTLIGGGEQEQELRALTAQLGLQGSVVFAGSVPNAQLGAALAAQHTLVLPSLREVWGLVVNEALACGLGVVVAESAGVTASVRGMTGVFEVGVTDESLADGLRRSRAVWTGPIAEPAVLQHTPETFAAVFADAARAAAARHGHRSTKLDA
jgi:glycosyltransferase involved in cell wall biosynthesis